LSTFCVPPSGIPRYDASKFASSEPNLRSRVVRRPCNSDPEAGLTAVEKEELPPRSNNITVGVDAVSQLTQPSDKNPSGQTKGLSEATFARQGRASLWKSHEEEELQRLIGTDTNSKGNIFWVNAAEAWNLLELSARSKANLSSK
jgi:hypothetical protein